MGLFSVLGTSAAGLKSVQDALSLVSQNVAGANTPGYVRRVQSPIQSAAGHVSIGSVQRMIDLFAQKSLWQSKTELSYANRLSTTLTDINQLFGVPGSETGLAGLMSKFKSSIRSLNADPTSGATQQTVVGQAKLLINAIHKISNSIQSARNDAEGAISNHVASLQRYLNGIAQLNKSISAAGSTPDPTLLDQRDALVANISELIGIQVKTQNDGTIQIITDSGFPLVDQSGAAQLKFDARGELKASDHYDVNPLNRTVGTITATSPSGAPIDLLASGLLKSGELGALIDLRDDVLVTAQSQIDDIAAGLAASFSDFKRQGTAIASGQSIDLAGLQSGNRIHVSYTDSAGKIHHVALVGVNGASNLPLPPDAARSDGEEVFGIDTSQGMTAMAASIQTALNGIGNGLTVSSAGGSVLNFVATSPASLSKLSATLTSTALGDGAEGLLLFVDGQTGAAFTDSYDGVSQRVGFASRISLNSSIVADPAKLVTWGAASPPSGFSRTSELVDRITSELHSTSVKSKLGLAGGSANLENLVVQMIQVQSIATNGANATASSMQTAMNFAEQRMSAVSGVNMDNELANMTALQSAYAANARIMTAAREMLDTLMRI